MYIRNVFHASCSQLALPRCEFDFLLYVRYVVLMPSLHSIFRDVWALIYILYLNAYAVHLNPGQMGGGVGRAGADGGKRRFSAPPLLPLPVPHSLPAGLFFFAYFCLLNELIFHREHIFLRSLSLFSRIFFFFK
jgi:hypothetical protein